MTCSSNALTVFSVASASLTRLTQGFIPLVPELMLCGSLQKGLEQNIGIVSKLQQITANCSNNAATKYTNIGSPIDNESASVNSGVSEEAWSGVSEQAWCQKHLGFGAPPKNIQNDTKMRTPMTPVTEPL